MVCALLLSAIVAQAQPKVVAYVPNWIDLERFAGTIDYAKVTHLNIAFENPVNGEGEMSFNPDNVALVAKAKAAGVKVLVSIGGGSASSDKKMRERYFSLLAETRRARFAALLANYVESHGFDGLDVDIEGPAINGDYGAFIHELAALLKPKNKLLTAALSQGYGFGKAYKGDEYTYADIIAAHPGAEKKDQAGETIWYNGIPTIQAKTQFVLDQELAGIMIWSLNSDADGEHSLLKAIHETLR